MKKGSSSNLPKKLKPNERTIDQFLKGNTNSSTNKDESVSSKITPKIKVPLSSGYESILKPQVRELLYPKNPQFRSYQQDIVTHCVCYNSLVCLPTGLGKTHIASIIIMNFTLWFPKGKIFFLAPTRPLVRQQRNSLLWFYQKIGIDNIFEMNGQMAPKKRQMFYKSKKIFFSTPQTFENDLKEGRIQYKDIVLIIFDECHRAVGNSSYSQIIKKMDEFEFGYRIVGLSATPGNQQEKIQEVITNLNIAKVIYKDETDPDVSKYLHDKKIIEVVIDSTEIIRETTKILDEFCLPFIGLLIGMKVIEPWSIQKGLNAGSFFMLKEQFDKRIHAIPSEIKGSAYNALKVLNFMITSKKALMDQGYQSFKNQFFRELEPHQQNVKGFQQKINKTCKTKIINNQKYARLRQLFISKSNCLNHPKLQKLKQLIEEFFKERKQANKQSKVIIFTQFRNTAKQIKDFLINANGISCELFHGQSKTLVHEDQFNEEGEWSNTLTSVLHLPQKQQINLIDRYKNGEINTLISTCIGEEGLDIGEVDCIFCYDGGHSPIRRIQRCGRTGRKREGKVFILLMEGKQLADYKKGLVKGSKMKQMLKKDIAKFQVYAYNTTMFQEHSVIPIIIYDNQKKDYLETNQYQKNHLEYQKSSEGDEKEKIYKKQTKKHSIQNQKQKNNKDKIQDNEKPTKKQVKHKKKGCKNVKEKLMQQNQSKQKEFEQQYGDQSLQFNCFEDNNFSEREFVKDEMGNQRDNEQKDNKDEDEVKIIEDINSMEGGGFNASATEASIQKSQEDYSNDIFQRQSSLRISQSIQKSDSQYQNSQNDDNFLQIYSKYIANQSKSLTKIVEVLSQNFIEDNEQRMEIQNVSSAQNDPQLSMIKQKIFKAIQINDKLTLDLNQQGEVLSNQKLAQNLELSQSAKKKQTQINIFEKYSWLFEEENQLQDKQQEVENSNQYALSSENNQKQNIEHEQLQKSERQQNQYIEQKDEDENGSLTQSELMQIFQTIKQKRANDSKGNDNKTQRIIH